MVERGEVGIVGAGSWGTALANIFAQNNFPVTIWAYEKEVAEGINKNHKNPYFLSFAQLHHSIKAVTDIKEAVENKKYIFIVVPSKWYRNVFKEVKKYIDIEKQIIVSCTKGLDYETGKRMSEILLEELGGSDGKIYKNVVVLSGPSHAEEVINNMYTSVVVASYSVDSAIKVQKTFSTGTFRIYAWDDVVGVELGGALKNIIAIVAGIIDGLGLGDNAKAAVVTRGLAEIARLGVRLGAKKETFMGLSGMGDLIVTCYSKHSRNRYVGEQLAKGKKLQEIEKEMRMVAEGVETTKIVVEKILPTQKIEMPLTQALYKVLFQNVPINDLLKEITSRPLKMEFYW